MSNQLQHKLLNYEVEPPAGMWNAISEALEDQSTTTAEKLRQFEAAPPAHLWKNIEESLDTQEETHSATPPLYRRISAPLRYGSAAAILLLVALSITFFFNRSGNSRETARQESPAQPPKPAAQPADQVTTIRESEDPQEKRSRRKTRNAPKITDNEVVASTTDNSTDVADNPVSIKTTTRTTGNRYLTVASETGRPVRLSKKVLPVFDCAEHSTTLERFKCQENIEALQKMASSLISPSGDFASLVDMIKTLEENR